MKCVSCSKKIKKSSRYCKYCGYKITKVFNNKDIVLKSRLPSLSVGLPKENPIEMISSHRQQKQLQTSLKGKSGWGFILTAVVLFTIFFTFTAVNITSTMPGLHNIVLEYYTSQIYSLKQSWIYLIISFIALVSARIFLANSHKNKRPTLRFIRTLLLEYVSSSFFALVTAFLISFLTMYIYAVIHINTIVFELKNSPNTIGVEYTKDTIVAKLISMTTVPHIISTTEKNTLFSLILANESNSDSYYRERIIKSMPSTLVMSFDLSQQPVILIGNTLVMNSIDKNTMQAISPIIAKILISHYFTDRYLKDNPSMNIIGRQDYLALRQDQINQQVAQIDTALQYVAGYIHATNNDINSVRQKIADNQNGMQSSTADRDAAFNNCITAGYWDYFTNYYFHYFTQNQCNANKNQWDSVISQYQQNISDWNNRLQYYQGQLLIFLDSQKFLLASRTINNAKKDSTPQELGLFSPPSSIRVVLDTTSPKAINEFIETLIHENLHYQSFVSQNRQLDDPFFEEGLTEYFARRVIAKEMGININIGYPTITKIIAQMMKKIPEKQFEQIYFTKDQSGLEELLNTTFGKNFYQDTKINFTAFSYSSADQALKIANSIMAKIGGAPLKMEDLYSTDISM